MNDQITEHLDAANFALMQVLESHPDSTEARYVQKNVAAALRLLNQQTQTGKEVESCAAPALNKEPVLSQTALSIPQQSNPAAESPTPSANAGEKLGFVSWDEYEAALSDLRQAETQIVALRNIIQEIQIGLAGHSFDKKEISLQISRPLREILDSGVGSEFHSSAGFNCSCRN